MRIAGTALIANDLGLLISDPILVRLGHDSAVDNQRIVANGLKPLTFMLLGGGPAFNIREILE